MLLIFAYVFAKILRNLISLAGIIYILIAWIVFIKLINITTCMYEFILLIVKYNSSRIVFNKITS